MIPSSTDERVIDICSGNCSAQIHRFGATVISWKVNGNSEQLFLSSKAQLDGSKPIRGGIPLVFPQFGPSAGRRFPQLAQHGFARNVWWRVVHLGSDHVSMKIDASDAPDLASAFPFAFSILYEIRVKADNSLITSAMVRNEGEHEFSCDWLFHTYFAVSDIANIKVPGLLEQQLDGQEYDERFHKHSQALILIDNSKKIVLNCTNLPDCVVWNPGNDKARTMADLGPGEERRFVCVEAGAIGPPGAVTIQPGDSAVFSQVILYQG